MKMRPAFWGVAGLCGALVVGCGEQAPPLDELPLRDALRADPGVVAALPDDARARLAARLEAARLDDDSSDPVEPLTIPTAEVSSLDSARSQRQAEALIVGAISDQVARATKDDGAGASSTGLPPMEGMPATLTAAIEARALDGAAGTTLRGLLARAGARRLERVVGWPVGAIAVGDTVYVGAAWLVARAPVSPSADAGVAAALSGPLASTAAVSGTRSAVTAQQDAGVDGSDGGADPSDGGVDASDSGAPIWPAFDAGTTIYPTPPSPPPQPPSSGDPTALDACAAGSDGCASGGDGCDSEDDEGDSCGSSSDDTDSCTPPDDGSNCRVAPGRGRPRAATLLWVLTPLGFLLRMRR